jgi:protein-S-isoprenylcysteine O-methyltransferase Ste14
MALLIPPQLLALLTAVFMWCLSASNLVTPLQFSFLTPLGLALLVAGGAICVAAFIAVNKARSSTNAHCPVEATALVRRGIYKYSRHPLYLGMTLVLAAVFCFFACALNIIPLVLFIMYIDKFQIQPEEEALSVRFPKQVQEYQAQVRRWI